MSVAVTSAGLAIHLADGDGPAVLWIHGYTLDSTTWAPLWAALPGWRHVAVDLPGHGRSRPLGRHESLRAWTGELAGIVDAYAIEHVVGMSFGGMVALELALAAPPRLASLALGSPALAAGPTDDHAATRNLELARLYRERGRGPWLRAAWMRSPPDIFRGAARQPELWERLAACIDGHRWDELDNGAMERLTREAQLPRLVRVACRTLLLVGEDDMAAFKRCAELIQRTVPASRRIYLAGAGHLGLLESPSQVAPLLAAHWQAAIGRAAERGVA